MKRKIIILSVLIGVSVLFVLALLFGIMVYARANIDFETDELLFEEARQGTIVEYYAYDKLGQLKKIYEGSFGGRKSWTDLCEISDYLTAGFISVEDRDFYSHSGVNVKRTLGAFLNYIFHFRSDFGGSTINQQVVKNISGDNEYTAKRKINEIIRAYHLNTTYEKEEILELYMNIVPMTGNIYGVGAAAEEYFGKSAGELNLAEAAVIVGITNSPARYNPYLHPEACLTRRNTVLYAMYDNGAITAQEYERAREEPLGVIPPSAGERYSSWFIETANSDIIKDAVKKYGVSESAARLMLRGAKVYLTVDTEIQDILEDFFEDYANLPSEVRRGVELSMTVVDNRSGNLVGVIGGAGEKRADRLFNNALSPIVPASTMKPLSIYAPMLDSGVINWATVLDDVPVSFVGGEGELRGYPKNSPDIYDGLTTVADGIMLSKNTLAARLYNMCKPEDIYSKLEKDYSLALSKVDTSLAALALGQLDVGVSLKSLTDAYTVFPSDGYACVSRSYYGVVNGEGEVILEKTEEKSRVMSAESARIMCKMLERVVTLGTARRISLKDYIDVAGKTGTSGGSLDRLFIGFTPYYTAGIWAGRPDRSEGTLGLSPSHIEIWDRLMTEIHRAKVFGEAGENTDGFNDGGLLYLPYCRDSGCVATEICELDPRGSRVEYGYFTEDNKPVGECKTHILCNYDSVTGAVAHDGCPASDVIKVALLDVERRFPVEVTVTDAEFVYRQMNGVEPGDSYNVPYFIYTLEDGEFVGISKGKKQFNSGCYIHK